MSKNTSHARFEGSFRERSLRVFAQYARRKGCAAVAVALIGAGAGLVGTGNLWALALIAFLEKQGIDCPEWVRSAIANDYFSRVVGVCMVIAGPLSLHACAKKSRGTLSINITPHCEFFYHTLIEGVYGGPPTRRIPGAKFYYELSCQLVAMNMDIEIIGIRFEVVAPERGIVNDHPEIKLGSEWSSLDHGWRLARGTLVHSEASADVFYRQRACPPSTMSPADCEEATVRGFIRYRVGDSDREVTDLLAWYRTSSGSLIRPFAARAQVVERGYEWGTLERLMNHERRT